MNGILIADKPADWTSHDVVAKLRGVLKTKRIGHGGTLDPMATGVLPLFIGRATRAAEFCENAKKEYIAGLRLGVVTDTQDITGKIQSENDVSVSADDLTTILNSFLGAQKQIPPMYSAIKQNGKKLYELARSGIEVPRQERDIFISLMELLSGEGDEFQLRIVCSKGTYVRTLCHDIGTRLGCGGTMSSLRRTKAGVFSIESASTLDEIIAAMTSGNIEDLLLPLDSIFSDCPVVRLSSEETRKCKNGASCKAEELPDGRYRFYGPDNEFLFLGDVVNGETLVMKRFFGNS